MRRAIWSAAIVVAVLGSTSVAHASAFCFFPGATSPEPLVVVQNFVRPAKGACKVLAGWEIGTVAQARPVTGTACLNTTGNVLRASYLVGAATVKIGPSHATVPAIFVTVDLPYPALSAGTAQVHVESSGFYSFSDGASAGLCPFGLPTLP
jgi:hypothetical protein